MSYRPQEDNPLLIRAFTLALSIHEEQRRKSSIVAGTPYASHLLETAGMVWANGGTPEVVAAALLHDAVEDQGQDKLQLIRDTCGEDVSELVEMLTEKGTGTGKKAPWKARKLDYIQRIKDDPLEVVLIILCDKLQNLRELSRRCLQVETSEDDNRTRKEFIDQEFGGGFNDQKWFHTRLSIAIERRLFTNPDPEHPIYIGIDMLLNEFVELSVALFSGR